MLVSLCRVRIVDRVSARMIQTLTEMASSAIAAVPGASVAYIVIVAVDALLVTLILLTQRAVEVVSPVSIGTVVAVSDVVNRSYMLCQMFSL